MKNKTRKDYEEYLNNLYSESYSQDDAVEQFAHLGTDNRIRAAWGSRTLGSMLRRNDPIAFEVGYNEWS